MLNNHFKTQPQKATHKHHIYTDRFIKMICGYVFFSRFHHNFTYFGAIRKFSMPLFIVFGVFLCVCLFLFFQSHFVNTQSFVLLCFNCEPIFVHILSIEHSTTFLYFVCEFSVVVVWIEGFREKMRIEIRSKILAVRQTQFECSNKYKQSSKNYRNENGNKSNILPIERVSRENKPKIVTELVNEKHIKRTTTNIKSHRFSLNRYFGFRRNAIQMLTHVVPLNSPLCITNYIHTHRNTLTMDL